ncbi:histidine kinase [Schaalia sp. 19OD2882]|uniref:histidine kinase n=1 Tax=Schaalia sp. 19OD2882 TaxID=2794089 RepID=UPI0020A775C7|nr:histidine kinase [Schaalia sp. 19OD2882]
MVLGWTALFGVEPIALAALSTPLFICTLLLARGYPRWVPYLAAGAHGLAFVVYMHMAFSPPGAHVGLILTGIVATPCLVGAEIVRRHRHMVTTSERNRRERLEQQRRLVVSELHDTVVRDLSHAVMLAEQSRLAHPDDDLLQRELATVILPVRTALRQLRQGLKAMSTAKGDDALLLLASSPPPRLSETIAGSRASLADRGATLVEEGIELLDNPMITPGVHQQLVRVIGELITNASKYASPSSTVSLVVECDGRTVECMCVNAISSDVPTSSELSSKVGLDGAQRRIETLGGTFTVNRSAERWSVVFSVPIQV